MLGMERWPSRITTVQVSFFRSSGRPSSSSSQQRIRCLFRVPKGTATTEETKAGRVGPVRCFCGAPPNGAFQHTPRQSICSLRNRLTRRNIYLQLLRRLFLFPKATPQRLCGFPYNNRRGMSIRPIAVVLSTHFMDWIDM